MTPEDRLRFVQDMLGYGNFTKNTRIAIIGYEEGGVRSWGEVGKDQPMKNKQDQQKEDDDLLLNFHEALVDGFLPVEKWKTGWENKYAVTEKMQCYLCKKLRNINVETKEFRAGKFCRDFEVTGNLYSIGKTSKDMRYPDETRLYFGLQGNRDDIRTQLLSDKPRWDKFRRLVKNLEERKGLIVFMSMDDTEMGRIKTELFPQQSFEENLYTGDGYEFSGHSKRKRWRRLEIYATSPACCFVQHPSHGWFNESVANRLVTTLKDEHLWTA